MTADNQTTTQTTKSTNNEKYVLSVDIGTTSLRCHIYDKNVKLMGKCQEKMYVDYPKQGYCEIKPDTLWELFSVVCRGAVKDANMSFDQITCMGLSTLRNTFITWNRHTGEPLHNFIVWKDLRTTKLCKEWNRSIALRSFNLYNRMLYTLKRCNRTLSAAHFKLVPGTPAAGFLWLIQNNPEVREKMLDGNLMYGTVETWLVYKLTGKHVTEASSAGVTGLFDLFEMNWNTTLLNILQIPSNCLPEVIDNDGDFGKLNKSIFGAEIPITAVIADQQSAMFGECTFNEGDMKLTLGTGSFLSVNTGSQAYPSLSGTAYPAIGWKLSSEEKPCYILESDSSDTGTSILWAQQLDFFEEPKQTISLANSVENSGGVFFVPAFSGIQAPINDCTAVSSLIGLNPLTSKAHIVRAVLEAIAFRVLQMHTILQSNFSVKLNSIRANGGISNNDFILQLISDLTKCPVERAENLEMSTLGVTFLAGLSMGIWKNKEEIYKLRRVEKVFTPQTKNLKHYIAEFVDWQRAIDRCLKWYSHN